MSKKKLYNDALRKPKSRDVSPKTRLFLFVRAGGRCEFDGCNRYLIEHHLTKSEGVFAQMAHIWAFGDKGPRANPALDGNEIHRLPNLMLLCPECHKLIDDDPVQYTLEVLRGHKKAHEDRVFMLTDTKPDRHTVALSLKAKVGGQMVTVSLPEMQQAVAPRYVGPRDLLEIDLTAIQDRATDAFWSVAGEEVRAKVAPLYTQAFESGPARHVSVFALAPIPLLIVLGRSLSSKVPTTLFQRHRDTESWKWKETGCAVEFETATLQKGAEPLNVALLLSLSGRIPQANLPEHIDASFTIYETTLVNVEPSVRFLEAEASLHAFRDEFLRMMQRILRDHDGVRTVHLFPAVPAPVAVAIGRDLLPKRDPTLIIYDFDKRADETSFVRTIEVNHPEE
jgi:SMODS-associated and fused to various effectors sensor domain/HNH endonuclease